MDWLRIGAFALLILYHIAMVFADWNYHVKSAHAEGWIAVPMLLVNAWRLSLLFVVSGYASRALLARSPSPRAFAWGRSKRLALPLAFGIAVIVPPQPWAELVSKAGYHASYWTFWTRDYFRFSTIGGLDLPSWNHLWFIAYLWLYTLMLALVMAGSRLVRAPVRLQGGFDALFGHRLGGIGVIALPFAWYAFIHARWFAMAAETHALFGDGIAHISYLPAFLFGFALAGSPVAMAAIGRWWPLGAAMALAGYGFVAGVELRWIGPFGPGLYARYGIAHAAEQWGAIIALIGLASRFLNRDHPIRATLTEAVFPFYLVHQTIIVLVALWLMPAGLPFAAEFAILVAATVAGCAAFYYGGRRFRWLRPLIGLRLHPRPVRPALL